MNISKIREILSDFSGKDIEDRKVVNIRQMKREIAMLRQQVNNLYANGRFVRDDDCIVLSAPRIIIGNVDDNGMLVGGSEVIIRSNNVKIDGVGDGGTITCKAPVISHEAVDPGIDGRENTVLPTSTISSVARSVYVGAQETTEDPSCYGVFVPETPPNGSVLIHASRKVSIDAAAPNKVEKDRKDALSDIQVDSKAEYKSKATSILTDLTPKITNLMGELKVEDKCGFLNLHNVEGKINASAKYAKELPYFMSQLDSCYAYLSCWAEAERQYKSLEKDCEAINKEYAENPNANVAFSDKIYATKSTRASVSISSERVDISSKGGDGKYRQNKEAGVFVYTNTMSITGYNDEADAALKNLMPYSELYVNMKDISIFTSDAKKTDGKENSTTYDPSGTVSINTFSLNVETGKEDVAVTHETENKVKRVTTATGGYHDYNTDKARFERLGSAEDIKARLGADPHGNVTINSNAITLQTLNTIDEEKKVDGSILLNGKTTYLVGVNKCELNDKDIVETDAKPADGSKLYLYAEKINEGICKDDGTNFTSNAKVIATKFELADKLVKDNEKELIKIEMADGKLTSTAKEITQMVEGTLTSKANGITQEATEGKITSKAKGITQEVTEKEFKIVAQNVNVGKDEKTTTTIKGNVEITEKGNLKVAGNVDADGEMKSKKSMSAPEGEIKSIKGK